MHLAHEVGELFLTGYYLLWHLCYGVDAEAVVIWWEM